MMIDSWLDDVNAKVRELNNNGIWLDASRYYCMECVSDNIDFSVDPTTSLVKCGNCDLVQSRTRLIHMPTIRRMKIKAYNNIFIKIIRR